MRWLLPFLFVAAPLWAQSPEATAQEAIDRLQQARSMLDQAGTRRDRVAALTETVQAYQDGLSALREGVRQVARQEQQLGDELLREQDAQSHMLAALQAIAQLPRPVIVEHPGGPLAAARAGGIWSDLTKALETDAIALRAQLDALAELRAMRIAGQQTLQEGLEGAQAARSALGVAISDRTDLPRRFETDPLQMALLESSVASLGAFMSDLSRTFPATDTVLLPDSSWPLPVDGYVLPNDGSGRPGVRIATAPAALVTTPVAATLLFQGALLEYGEVVILEPSQGVMVVFAGLGETFGVQGEVLAAGAAVGLVKSEPAGNDGNLTDNLESVRDEAPQSLYLEVREGQDPVNPDVWFALE